MKNLKLKRNALIIAGSIVIALIQLGCYFHNKRMDWITISTFTVAQYLYMDFVKATFDKKIEELATENNGN
jgi:hypothetical protein